MEDSVKIGTDGYPESSERQTQGTPGNRPSLPISRTESKPEETQSRSSRASVGASPANGRDEFTGALQPLQVKIPADLIQSLKLHAIGTDKTMSELVLECLTSDQQITKAWVSSRRAA